MYYRRMPRTGRRPGPESSRAAVLDAARRRFAELGFEGASIRAIAADAGVDPAVVLHFFGSKDGLFRAVVGWPFEPAAVAAQVATPGPEGVGARLARVFLGYWEDPRTRAPLLALLRSAMTHPAAATLLREFVVREMFEPLAGLVAARDARLSLELAAAHLLGVAVLRYALRVEPLASVPVDELVRELTPSLATHLEPPTRPESKAARAPRPPTRRADTGAAGPTGRHRRAALD
jgi:AcrR family transcriptional regulator